MEQVCSIIVTNVLNPAVHIYSVGRNNCSELKILL